MFLDRGHVRRHIAPREQAAVNLRVQRLHAAIEHFRESCVVGDFCHRQACIGQQLGRPAGGQKLHAERMKFASEFEDAGLVGNGDEGGQLSHGVT